LLEEVKVSAWVWYAIAAAILYGLHQVFTKLASSHIDSSVGAFVVEASAAISIILYMVYLKSSSKLVVAASHLGIVFSVLTGLCVGAGTVLFFLLFQKGGPLSAVPAVLAAGAAIMAVVGFVVLREPFSWPRLLGVVLSLVAMYLLFQSPAKA
jgi:bacterial/archaeal transporter family protein